MQQKQKKVAAGSRYELRIFQASLVLTTGLDALTGLAYSFTKKEGAWPMIVPSSVHEFITIS